jgi:hypothetical protein
MERARPQEKAPSKHCNGSDLNLSCRMARGWDKCQKYKHRQAYQAWEWLRMLLKP